MIRHRQKPHVPGQTPGNCLQCCVAGILDEPVLDRIPHVAWLDPTFTDYAADNPHAWWGILCDTLHRYGAHFRVISSADRTVPLDPNVFPLSRQLDADEQLIGVIGCGSSPRGPWGHAVLVDDHGHLLHDPHPSGVGVPFLDEALLVVRHVVGEEVAA